MISQGIERNLNHPAIEDLCVEFYYNPQTKCNSAARLFPADFTACVPENAVALAVTAVWLFPDSDQVY